MPSADIASRPPGAKATRASASGTPAILLAATAPIERNPERQQEAAEADPQDGHDVGPADAGKAIADGGAEDDIGGGEQARRQCPGDDAEKMQRAIGEGGAEHQAGGDVEPGEQRPERGAGRDGEQRIETAAHRDQGRMRRCRPPVQGR